MPLPAAIALITTPDKNQILLVRRKDVPVWVLPGGGIDPGETADQALIREVQEETGLTVCIDQLCAEYSPINKLASPTSLYRCSPICGQLALSNETSAVSYFPVDQLPKLIFPVHLGWIQENLHSTQCVRRPLREVTYWAVFKWALAHPWMVGRFLLGRKQ